MMLTPALSRQAASDLALLLEEFPAVAILGPRQVGKTTLAIDWAARWLAQGHEAAYLDLEARADAAKLADPAAYFAEHAHELVILDEVQRAPQLFAELRGVIDARRRGGQRNAQFLLLGSATGVLLQQSAESLAGRIAYLELPPLLATEAPAQDLPRLWVRGGFPDSFLARNDAASLRWREQFIATYLERDIPQFGPRIPAETLRRLWTMLAHEQGQPLNAAKLAASLAVSGQTIARYLYLLSDLMLVRRLPPWAGNVGKRLVRAPKVYVRDSGIVHALLGLATLDDVLAHPVAGGSWEGHVIDNLIAAAPLGTQAYFYRSTAGAEIDLLLELPNRQRWAVEVKRSSAPSVSKGFHIAAQDLGVDAKFVVYSGAESYPLGNGLRAMSLLDLQQRLAGQTAAT
jgi:uncharacterized protein